MKISEKVANWAYSWEIQFNPNVNKQAQNLVISRKLEKEVHPKIVFNNSPEVRSYF